MLEPPRSAEPPHSSGSVEAIADRVLPLAARVDRLEPASKTGRTSSSSAGSRPARTRSSSSRACGLACPQASKRFSQAACSSAPRWPAWARVCSSTCSGRAKRSLGSRPRFCLRPATSLSPSLAPWEEALPCLVGHGQAMMVLRRISEGRLVSARAASSASCRAFTSS